MKTLHAITSPSGSRVNNINGAALFLAGTVALSLTPTPASALTRGMVADNDPSSVTVFDADTDTVLGSVAIPPGNATGDVLITPDQKLGFVTDFNFQVYVIDLSGPTPVLAGGTNPIAISNHGEDLALSPDGKFLLVTDGSAVEPVSVIDIAARSEVDAFDTGTDNTSVDVCSDASVLVTSFNNSTVRRLTLNGAGVLSDTGEALSVNSPINVYCAPGAKSGVVVNAFNKSVQSFTIPGLAAVDTRALSGGSYGLSAAVNPTGDRVYVRSEGGAVDAFGYNAATGALGATPLFSIPISNATSTFFGMDQMALGGGKLYVPQPSALKVYDAASGGLLTSITDANIAAPTGVAVTAADICAGKPPAGAIVGTNAMDFLIGTPGDDVIFGQGGPDYIFGNGGNDIICGGPGSDIISGSLGKDKIFGGDGSDFCYPDKDDTVNSCP